MIVFTIGMSLKRQRESDDEGEAVFKQVKGVIEESQINNGQNGKLETGTNKSKQISKSDKSITCSLPPTCSQEPQTFNTWKQYQSHYLSAHSNTCSECSKNFPTPKLLDLHIAENHDPFIKIKLQKGEPVFGCFVEGCDRVFKDHKKRRLHLIDKHDFPKDFIFSIVDRGIKKGDTSLIKKNTKSYGVWKPA